MRRGDESSTAQLVQHEFAVLLLMLLVLQQRSGGAAVAAASAICQSMHTRRVRLRLRLLLPHAQEAHGRGQQC